MTRKEYEKYVAKVETFFDREGITHLSMTIPDYGEQSKCKYCGRQIDGAAFFSYLACECCGHTENGDRYHCSGFHPQAGNILCFDVCPDCMYFSQYGQLEDKIMLEIEG